MSRSSKARQLKSQKGGVDEDLVCMSVPSTDFVDINGDMTNETLALIIKNLYAIIHNKSSDSDFVNNLKLMLYKISTKYNIAVVEENTKIGPDVKVDIVFDKEHELPLDGILTPASEEGFGSLLKNVHDTVHDILNNNVHVGDIENIFKVIQSGEIDLATTIPAIIDENAGSVSGTTENVVDNDTVTGAVNTALDHAVGFVRTLSEIQDGVTVGTPLAKISFHLLFLVVMQSIITYLLYNNSINPPIASVTPDQMGGSKRRQTGGKTAAIVLSVPHKSSKKSSKKASKKSSKQTGGAKKSSKNVKKSSKKATDAVKKSSKKSSKAKKSK